MAYEKIAKNMGAQAGAAQGLPSQAWRASGLTGVSSLMKKMSGFKSQDQIQSAQQNSASMAALVQLATQLAYMKELGYFGQAQKPYENTTGQGAGRQFDNAYGQPVRDFNRAQQDPWGGAGSWSMESNEFGDDWSYEPPLPQRSAPNYYNRSIYGGSAEAMDPLAALLARYNAGRGYNSPDFY